MERQRTVSELTLTFVRDQIRILSAPWAPNPGWRDFGPQVENDITDKAVEDALQKLNNQFRQHNRSIFSTQATHHVVRQIERLYWDAINPELSRENPSSHVLEKGTDFTSSRIISSLPEELVEHDVDEGEQARYNELRQRLVELDARRREQGQRLAQYKQLKELLEPFKDPQSNIQPNLVTRNGELGEELDRMRMLVAKVAGKITDARTDAFAPEEDTSTPKDHEAKLSALLDMT